jgi:hypothetical protein
MISEIGSSMFRYTILEDSPLFFISFGMNEYFVSLIFSFFIADPMPLAQQENRFSGSY